MCWPLQGTSRYLFAANQQAIKKKNISFSVPFVGMNFTKDSLCNVNRLKYNSLTIFWGNLIWGWWFQILRGPCPLFSQGVQISCTELVSCELHMTLNLTRNTICIYLNLIDRNWKKKKHSSDIFITALTFHYFCTWLWNISPLWKMSKSLLNQNLKVETVQWADSCMLFSHSR